MTDDLYAKLMQTWPARAAKGLWEGLTLPGDVYQGNVSVYGADGRTNPEVINRSADLAGAVTMGAGSVPAEANALRAGAGGPPRLRSEVMDAFRNRNQSEATSDAALEALIAERQAGMRAAMAAHRASGNKVQEFDMRRRARPAVAETPTPVVNPEGAERLNSEVMRLFKGGTDQ